MGANAPPHPSPASSMLVSVPVTALKQTLHSCLFCRARLCWQRPPLSFRSSLLYLFQKHSPCPQHTTVTLHYQNPWLFPTQAQVRATYNCSPGAANSCRTPYCEKSKTFVVGSPEFKSRVCIAASWSSASSQLLSEPRFSPLPIGQHRHLQGSWYHGNFKALGKHSDQIKAGDNMAD